MYPVTDQDHEEINKRFTYHKPKNDQADRYQILREQFKLMAESILAITPKSREQALALTNLEQASMWTNAAIARNE